jgi:hypothetical protein
MSWLPPGAPALFCGPAAETVMNLRCAMGLARCSVANHNSDPIFSLSTTVIIT